MKIKPFVLILCATFVVLYWAQSGSSALPQTPSEKAQLHAKDHPAGLQKHVDPRVEPNNAAVALTTPFGQLDWTELRRSLELRGDHYIVKKNGLELTLTLDANLQQELETLMSRQPRVAGSLVLIDAQTGAIRALAEKQGDPGNPLATLDNALTQARAPAASLMKIITASAAMEEHGMEPHDEIAFRGGCQHLQRRNWLRQPAADRSKFSLAKAFGLSCNTVFARLAIYHSGLSSLREYAARYYMNRPIPSDLLLETSLAALPSPESATMYDVGEAGAGFGFSKLTPVHAALMSAAIDNGGRMLAPHIVAKAQAADGSVVYQASPQEIGVVVSPETAKKMRVLYEATIKSGTSRAQFRGRSVRNYIDDVGGKTGTLRDMEDRQTLYTWFSGLGDLPGSDRGLAVGVLIASPNNYLIRASSIAKWSFDSVYRLEKQAQAGSKGDRH